MDPQEQKSNIPARKGPGTAGLYFIASILSAAAIVLPALMTWFPPPLFDAAGTARLPFAVVVIAAWLGPLVVFVYARKGTPLAPRAMRRVIAAQLLAFAGSLLALYVQRPVYLVFTIDRFDLVLARDLSPHDLAKASGEFSRRPLGAPRFVAALQPGDKAEMQRIAERALEGGKDLQAYPQYYVPYASQAANALKRSKPLSAVYGRDDDVLRKGLEAAGRTPENTRFLPLRARRKDGLVLLDAASGEPLAVLPIDPW